jgi:hypothetical protein
MTETRMKKLLILFHSRTGGARQMAGAAYDAACAEGDVTARLLAAQEARAEDMLAADAYLFAAPENLASLSGPMKDLFDRVYYPLLDRIQGRAYATMICAGTDGAGAARQVARMATGWRLREVAAPLIVLTGAQTPEAILAPKTIAASDLSRCGECGLALAAGLAAGIF